MLPPTYSLFSKVSPAPLVTPVLTVHANYVAGDYIGASGVPMEFKGCGSSGYILAAEIIDYAVQSVSTELWLFNASVTPPADSAAWSISDADALKCVAVIPLSAYYASALNSLAWGTPSANGAVKYTSASGSLFGCIVTRGAPTYASGDVSIRLSVLPNGE